MAGLYRGRPQLLHAMATELRRCVADAPSPETWMIDAEVLLYSVGGDQSAV